MSKRPIDERQQVLDFEAQINQVCETVRLLEEQREARTKADPSEFRKAEFYVEVAAGCKTAIRESGLSRDQVVDLINQRWRPMDDETEVGPKPALTLPMLNNYLSKPTACKLPAWLIYAICDATGSMRPLAVQVENLGSTVITEDEEKELMLGKLEANIRTGTSLRRLLVKRITPGGAQ